MSGLKTDETGKFYIDIENINKTKDKYIAEYRAMEKEFLIADLGKILSQKELREYCREKEINILDLNVVTGKTEFQLLFDNNLKYVKENINLSYGKEEILNLYKNKGLFEYIQRLEKRKNSLDKEKDILEIRMIENTISKFEVKNYINYLEKEYELRIAESKYKKYYNIPNIEEPTKPQPKQEKKSKKRDYWER